MAFCPKCGAQVDDSVKFCPVCGAEIAVQAAQAAQTPPPPVAPAPNAYNNQNNGGYNQNNQQFNQNNQQFNQNNQNNQQFNANDFMNKLGNDHTAEFDPADIQANKGICALSYLGILFFQPLVCCPNSRYGKFHANQALLLLIVMAILGIVTGIISAICHAVFPSVSLWGYSYGVNGVGTFIIGLFGLVTSLVSLGGFLFGLLNTLSGKAKTLPLIGDKITFFK